MYSQVAVQSIGEAASPFHTFAIDQDLLKGLHDLEKLCKSSLLKSF